MCRLRDIKEAAKGLNLAHESHLALFVLTEGRVATQQKIIEKHRLSGYFEAVFEVPNNAASFERLREPFAAARVTVIGDHPDRDIGPARQGGLSAVLVPSRFRPSWNKEHRGLQASYVASDFGIAIE
jgi:FMN phosphatase YigB (HAD superfamily)